MPSKIMEVHSMKIMKYESVLVEGGTYDDARHL